ncbi:NADH-dependent alcohol dehydrogenase [Bacillus sp. Y1]|nr:iron-containing alcohol dehydrogenase [Bacillus sp. Y1]AYA77781.1 NADH-dependent alcohol dehydrogenase [Bacillus sp. Y1]
MKNFSYRNPTKLIFGKGQIEELRNELPKYGSKVLLVYGGGSIKRNGLYEEVQTILASLSAEVFELSGVEPNPRLSSVQKGINMARENHVDFILAVGGGSVLDCVKAIAVGVPYQGDVWDIIKGNAKAMEALPFGAILTLAATGSEMNNNSVITNWDTQEKIGWSSTVSYPEFSILDPVYTYSVPKDQTVYGMVDIMSHVFEQYFHHVKNTHLQDRFCESLLKTVIETAPQLIENLEDYDLRETILYTGTIALNKSLGMGTQGEWSTHDIEHAVSAVYDIPHGGGLAILFPNWMKHVLDENVGRFVQFATRVFDIVPDGKSEREVALEGIEALRQFWNSIGAPSRLADYGIGDENLELMADKAYAKGSLGVFNNLTKEDIVEIYRASL